MGNVQTLVMDLPEGQLFTGFAIMDENLIAIFRGVPLQLIEWHVSFADHLVENFLWLFHAALPFIFVSGWLRYTGYQVSTMGRRRPTRGPGLRTDLRPRRIQLRVSAGSITASISRDTAMLSALPFSYCSATSFSNMACWAASSPALAISLR